MDRMLNDEEIKAIGGRLRNLRKKLGLTQQEFADKLFWDMSSYQKIENGKTLMTLDKAVQLHRNYNVDLNYFTAGDSLDSEDAVMHILENASREQSAEMILRLLEYMSRMIKMSLENGAETDT